MEIIATFLEKRSLGDDRVDTMRVSVKGAVSVKDIESLKKDGYTELFEHHVVLYKPSQQIEPLQTKIAELELEVAELKKQAKPIEPLEPLEPLEPVIKRGKE